MAENNDDLVFDDSAENLDDSVVAEESQAETIKKLRTRLKETEAKAREHLEAHQRAQADFINLRKRDEAAREEFLKFAVAGLIDDLIPVLDSCHLAAAAGHKDVEIMYKQLLNVLKRYGLEEVNPLGEIFNPREHEAIGTVESDKPEDDHRILEVLSKGYILQGKIIRPAKVKIGKTNG